MSRAEPSPTPRPPRGRLCLAACLCLAAWLCTAAWPGPRQDARDAPAATGIAPHITQDEPLERRFSATRPFGRGVTEADARVMAETAARFAALREVIRHLVTLPEVRVAGSMAASPLKSPSLLALARATAEPSVLLVGRSRRDATVTVTVALPGGDAGMPSGVRARDALIHTERLALYEKAVSREQELLERFDRLVLPRDKAGMRPDRRDEAAAIANEIRALWIFVDQLPAMNGIWKNPAAVREAMKDALRLFPDSALCRNALGDASLQLGRSQEALEEQTLAIQADPSFARAYHSRGAAALTLGHLSSAVADFTTAIRLEPGHAAYFSSRGMARHLQGETDAMCVDLRQACAMGRCQEFQWAVTNAFCAVAE